jgi:hypothetical protein
VLESHFASFEEIQEKIVNSLDNNPATSSSQPPLGNEFGTTRSETNGVKRRSFLKGFGATSALLLPMTAMLANRAKGATSNASVPISKGDAAILTFLGAAEIIESDLWIQYWELGGTQDNEFAKMTGGNAFYTDALSILDSDMAQYVHDNTDDEITHAAFIRNYLASRGASTADLDLLNGHTFRKLPGSTAQGSSGKLRLTNLTALNVDTSFWTRYRSDSQNPDLSGFKFGQAQNRPRGIKNRTAIPRNDADTAGSSIGNPTTHLKAIAFTAGFHFATIEQGGTSLYPSLAQRVQDKEVLQVVLSIGPTEAMHFQTWQDKAGNATPLTDTDPVTGSVVTFVDLTTNLIMPEPCPFINTSLPICSIVRPTNTQGAAMAAANFLIAMNLFAGQSGQFFQLLLQLATDADAASG